jgi:hypothetical protein
MRFLPFGLVHGEDWQEEMQLLTLLHRRRLRRAAQAVAAPYVIPDRLVHVANDKIGTRAVNHIYMQEHNDDQSNLCPTPSSISETEYPGHDS